jgi:predicted ester cyclase
MSVDDNKNLIRRYIEEVVNTGNINGIEQFISSNYTEVYGDKRYPVGINGATEHIIGVRQTYPDLQLTVDQQIAEGDWVATCITARGTHKGRWLGMKPTRKQVTYTGVNVDKVENGKITEHGGAANLLLELLEVGAIKVVGE